MSLLSWRRGIAAPHSPSARHAGAYPLRLPTLILAPLLALVFQASLPLYFDFLAILDLPLLMVIYFALGRRSPVAGLLAGAVIGVAQDSLSKGPIGWFGITNTVIGYVTSLLSGRVDTESPGVRFLSVFVLYYLHFLCFYFLGAFLVGAELDPDIRRSFMAALVNAVVGMLLFELLDRFRKPS